MNQQERWDTSVEFFNSLKGGDTFTAMPPGELRIEWVIIGKGFSDVGNLFLQTTGRIQGLVRQQTFYLTQFVAWKAEAITVEPEPEPTEASNLVNHFEEGKVFYTIDKDETIIRWETTRLNEDQRRSTPVWIDAGCKLGGSWIEQGFSAKALEQLNATTTRPKTERENELEAMVARRDAMLGELNSFIDKHERLLGFHQDFTAELRGSLDRLCNSLE